MKPEEELQQVAELMDSILEDNSVPRNIKKVVNEAKEKILSSGDLKVNIMGAIYSLDEIVNDINMPFHTRTEIWNIISELERIKEEIKE